MHRIAWLVMCMVAFSLSLLLRNVRRVFPFCLDSQSLQDELGYEPIAQLWREGFWHKMGAMRFYKLTCCSSGLGISLVQISVFKEAKHLLKNCYKVKVILEIPGKSLKSCPTTCYFPTSPLNAPNATVV